MTFYKTTFYLKVEVNKSGECYFRRLNQEEVRISQSEYKQRLTLTRAEGSDKTTKCHLAFQSHSQSDDTGVSPSRGVYRSFISLDPSMQLSGAHSESRGRPSILGVFSALLTVTHIWGTKPATGHDLYF